MGTSTATARASGIDREGYAIVDDVVPQPMLVKARAMLAAAAAATAIRRRDGATFAIRNLLSEVPALRAISELHQFQEIVMESLGPGAFVTRAIFFDKNPGANWAVPWHQDATIAVHERIETPGFGPWSVKAGVIHVRPPTQVLERMLTARVHLDDCDVGNGALKIVPGSHRNGVLDSDQIRQFCVDRVCETCAVRAGGVLFMRPLLLHASSPSERPEHRRVIHLEFAADPLPNGLEWNRA